MSEPFSTPAKPTSGVTHNSHLQCLENQRDAHMQNSRRHLITCSPKAWFEQYTAIRITEEDVSLIRSKLIQRGILGSGNEGWIKPVELHKAKAKENETYAPLTEISEAIYQTAKEVMPSLPDRTSVYETCPNNVPLGQLPGPQGRPDGRFVSTISAFSSESVGDSPWENINSVSLEEYKKKNTIESRHDVSSRVLSRDLPTKDSSERA
jgi:hypothetical protein